VSASDTLIEVLGGHHAEPKLTPGWRLRVRPPKGEDSVIALGDATISIGRADANDIHPDDSQLSRFHANIAKEGAGWVLSDLSSKNGTTANGRSIQRHILQHGDMIQAGETVLVFERGGSGGDAPTPAPAPAPVTNDAAAPDLDALVGLAEMMACAEDELAVLEDVAARTRDVVQCDRATIILVEEGTGKPLMRYSHQDSVTGESEELGGVVLQRALQANEPTIDLVPGVAPMKILIAPLQARYRKTGVLVMERGLSGRPIL